MNIPHAAQSFDMPPPAPDEPASPRWPLWVVYVSGVVVGATVLVTALGPAYGETPTLAAASVAAFGTFGLACTWLLNRIPYFVRVRPSTSGLALLWGGFAAIGFAMPANTAIGGHFAAQGDPRAWLMFAPLTEEPAKALGIVLLLLLAATRARTALDGLVVGSFVGLGFEVVEDIVQSINNAINDYPPGQRDNLGSLAVDVVHEVVRRSWTGHVVITGITGFAIAYAMTARGRSGVQRWSVATGLMLLAVAGHLLWNSHRFGVFYVLGQFCILALYLWLIKIGREQEARIYLPYLHYAAPSLVDPSEVVSMRSGRARRSARKTSAHPTGRARKRHRAIAHLAVAIGHGDRNAADRAVEALRHAVGFIGGSRLSDQRPAADRFAR